MNKAILMGRLTRDPEVKYTQSGEPMAVARETLTPSGAQSSKGIFCQTKQKTRGIHAVVFPRLSAKSDGKCTADVRASDGVRGSHNTLAVGRRFKRQGEQEADFIGCVAFGKAGEFAEKYFRKGQQVSVVGRIQVRSWEDKEGKKRWTTEVIVEEQYFAEGRKESGGAEPPKQPEGGFYPIDAGVEDDDLPF